MFKLTRRLLTPNVLMRSALFSPGTKKKVLAKGRTIPADVLIFDLEDAVAPESKEHARINIVDILEEGGFGNKTLAVRINSLDTPWGNEDLEAIASLKNLDAVVVPKVESSETLQKISDYLDDVSFFQKREAAIWPQIETPRGVLAVESIAGFELERVKCLVMGTSDLTADLGASHTPCRTPVLYCLSKCIAAARTYGVQILDGVHLDIADDEGFLKVCQQAKELGFDGKTLIHPKTVEPTNRIFGPTEEDAQKAQEIVKAFDEAKAKGDGIAVVDGKLIENLHVEEAKRIIQKYELVKDVHTNI